MFLQNTFEKTLIEISEFLQKEKIPHMVIGGVANAFRGIPRATLDIDITLLVQENDIQNFVRKISKKFKVLIGNPIAFVKKARVLPCLSKQNIRLDLIFAQLPYEEQALKRITKKKVNGSKIPVASSEDLIIMKAISTRNRDWEDIQGIVQQMRDRLDLSYLLPILKNLSQELEKPDILKRFLQLIR